MSKSVFELSKDELTELKENYYSMIKNSNDEDVSYEELVHIDALVADEVIYEEYKHCTFYEDDFFCNQ